MAKQKSEVVEGQPERKLDALDKILAEDEFKKQIFGTYDQLRVKPSRISTGSIFFDSLLEGGYRSGGFAQFYGETESGKTSQGLKWGKNWQDHFENGKVIIFNAEGRITEELLLRSGINTDIEKFRMVYTNRSDAIWSILERMIQKPEGYFYFFILDSTDACVRTVDVDKSFSDSEKIAGGAAVMSAGAKRISLLNNLGNHFFYMTSQLRDKMPAQNSKYIPPPGPSGGHAAKFYSSLRGNFLRRTQGDLIWSNPSLAPNDPENKPIGAMVTIQLEKTPNEKSGQKITFPVKYGLTGGIYRSMESMMLCTMFKHYARTGGDKGSFEIQESFAQELRENNITFLDKARSEKILRDAFDTNTELSEYVLQKYRKILIAPEV